MEIFYLTVLDAEAKKKSDEQEKKEVKEETGGKKPDKKMDDITKKIQEAVKKFKGARMMEL